MLTYVNVLTRARSFYPFLIIDIFDKILTVTVKVKETEDAKCQKEKQKHERLKGWKKLTL